MKEFKEAKVEVVTFTDDDVIATSGGCGLDGGCVLDGGCSLDGCLSDCSSNCSEENPCPQDCICCSNL